MYWSARGCRRKLRRCHHSPNCHPRSSRCRARRSRVRELARSSIEKGEPGAREELIASSAIGVVRGAELAAELDPPTRSPLARFFEDGHEPRCFAEPERQMIAATVETCDVNVNIGTVVRFGPRICCRREWGPSFRRLNTDASVASLAPGCFGRCAFGGIVNTGIPPAV